MLLDHILLQKNLRNFVNIIKENVGNYQTGQQIRRISHHNFFYLSVRTSFERPPPPPQPSFFSYPLPPSSPSSSPPPSPSASPFFCLPFHFLHPTCFVCVFF